jgi:hypothetical protein
MKLKLIKACFIYLVALSLFACAVVSDEPALDERLAEYGYRPGESIEQLDSYQVADWQYLDDRHLLFSNGEAEYYLLSFRASCSMLRSADRLAFKPQSAGLSRFDSAILSNATALAHCEIEAISMVYPSE